VGGGMSGSALLVGIDKYAEEGKRLPKLRAAVKDVVALKRALEEVCGFEDVRVLKNEEATSEAIKNSLIELAAKTEGKADTFWFHLAGHGLPLSDGRGGTVFAPYDLRVEDPRRTGLIGPILSHWLPIAERTIVVLDCCYADGMRNLELKDLEGKERFLIATSGEGQLALEMSDGSHSLFMEALLRALYREGQAPRGNLTLSALRVALFENMKRLVAERGAPQTPIINSKESEDWVLTTTHREWPSRLKRADFLESFVSDVPPPPDAEVATLVVRSQADPDPMSATSLAGAVEEGLNTLRHNYARFKKTPKPVAIRAQEAFAENAWLLRAIRALCRFPAAFFDITTSQDEPRFEAEVMILLGIRSVVRRGVTILSVGGERSVTDPLDLPFNLREVRTCAHSKKQLQEKPLPKELLSQRLIFGLRELRQGNYHDLPGFDAIRRRVSDDSTQDGLGEDRTDRARKADPLEEVLVLCPFSSEYRDTWSVLNQRLRDVLPKDRYRVLRIVDSDSPRLVTQTLYEHIREAAICVVDLTGLRPNVMLELGVRLASSPRGAICILDRKRHGEKRYRSLIERFDPILYDIDSTEDTFDGVLRRHEAAGENVSPWYDAVWKWIDVQAELPRPVHVELGASADRLAHEDEKRNAKPVLLYPNPELQLRAEREALERRIAGWLYLDSCLNRDPPPGGEDLTDGERKAIKQKMATERRRLGEYLLAQLTGRTGFSSLTEHIEERLAPRIEEVERDQ
jgi:hypothetical protein